MGKGRRKEKNEGEGRLGKEEGANEQRRGNEGKQKQMKEERNKGGKRERREGTQVNRCHLRGKGICSMASEMWW